MLQEINVLLTANIMDVLAKFVQLRQEAAKLREIDNINATPDINIDQNAINTALQNSMQPVDVNAKLTLGFNPVELDLSAVSLADINNAINSKLSSITSAIKLIINPDPIEINTANISQADVENALNAKLSSITAPLTATINLSGIINTDALNTAAIKSAIDAKIASVGSTSVNQKTTIVIDPTIDTSQISTGSLKSAINNALAMIGNLNTALNTQIVIDIGIATAQNKLNILIQQAQQLILLLGGPILVNINSSTSMALITQLQAQIAALQAQLNNLGGNGGGSGGGGGPGVGLLSNLRGIFSQVAAIMGTVIALKWFANVNSEIEQYRMQIGVLVKDVQRAEDVLQELKTFADKTPYETGEVVKAGKQLMAAGIFDYTTYLNTAGDWAAAVGAKLEETVGAMARANAGQFGESIERMRELGISTQDLWAQGLQFSKSNEFLGTADQLMTALNNIVRDKAGGMMDTLSQSFTGLLSTLESASKDLGIAITSPIFDLTKAAMSSMVDMYTSFKNGGGLTDLTIRVQSVIDALMAALSRIGEALSRYVSMDNLSSIWDSIKNAIGYAVDALNMFFVIIGEGVNAIASFSGGMSILGGLFGVTADGGDRLTYVFDLASRLCGAFALGLATIALGLKEIGALMQWSSDVIESGFKQANANLAENTAKNGEWYMKQYNNIQGLDKATTEANKSKGKSDQELAQKAMADAFANEKRVQAEIQNDEKRADIKSRLNKAMGMDSVELAKIEYEASQKSLKATIEAEEISIKVKTQVAQKALAAAKTTEERTKAEQQLADVQKQSLTVEEMKANVAEKQAAYYQAVINKQAELGKFAYSSMKLSAEVAAIEKMGGDATVKRYDMVKTAITEYLSEVDKIRLSQMAVSDSTTRMNIAMSNITAPKFVETGSIWTEKEKEVVGYCQAVGVNLQAIELMNQQQDSNEKINNVNRLAERLNILRAMLQNEKLGAEQRKQLIIEERSVFAGYTKSITDGITDAMNKIQALQNKIMSTASQASSLLKDVDGSQADFQKLANAGVSNYLSIPKPTLDDMKTYVSLQKQILADSGGKITMSDLVKPSDVMRASLESIENSKDAIVNLRANLEQLQAEVANYGRMAAVDYFAEWNGYIEQLKQTIGSALSSVAIGLSVDTTQAIQAVNQFKQQFTDTVNGMQSQVNVELPKPTVNYNTFQQTFQVGVNIQGNTLKDLGDAVDNARNLFGQELKSAFEEANAQYGF
ncbi:hypothetical protein [Pelosinus sp. sgz500959]|uniref:hypothetical protein n=1 Tax=Pelosinus sp. sgz500959 TaxID=3242472 RepID=UPI00366E31A9